MSCFIVRGLKVSTTSRPEVLQAPSPPKQFPNTPRSLKLKPGHHEYNLGQGQNQKCRTSNTRTPSQDFPPVDYASAAAIGIAVAMATLMGSGQMSSQAPGQMPGSLERRALCWELGARNLKFCHRGLRILLIIIQTPIIIFPKTLVQSLRPLRQRQQH